MNITISVQNILDSIENLSEEEQFLLFKQLKQQVLENGWQPRFKNSFHYSGD